MPNYNIPLLSPKAKVLYLDIATRHKQSLQAKLELSDAALDVEKDPVLKLELLNLGVQGLSGNAPQTRPTRVLIEERLKFEEQTIVDCDAENAHMKVGTVGFKAALGLWSKWAAFQTKALTKAKSKNGEVDNLGAPVDEAIMSQFFGGTLNSDKQNRTYFFREFLDHVVAPLIDSQARMTDLLEKNPADQDLAARLQAFSVLNVDILEITEKAVNGFLDKTSLWTSPEAEIKFEVTRLLTAASQLPEITKVRDILGYTSKIIGFAFLTFLVGTDGAMSLTQGGNTQSQSDILAALEKVKVLPNASKTSAPVPNNSSDSAFELKPK